MNELAGVLFDLFLIYLCARLAGEAFERLHLPPVVGELLAGVVIGPHALHLVGVPSGPMIDLFGSRHTADVGLDFVYEVIGQLGLIVLLFYVGLETPFDRLIRFLPRSAAVAVPGVAVTMALGTAFMLAIGHAPREALFVGAAMVATSVAISARVMQGLGVLTSREGQVILGAAVIDDVLGLIVLATVSDLAKTGGIDAREVATVIAESAAFVAFAALVARRAVTRYSLHLDQLRMESAPLAFALVVMLGMSALAAGIGLAGVVGAFLAGIVLSESREHHQLGRQVRPIYEFLTPFFFVLTGAKVDPGVFGDAHTVGLTLGITGLAIVGKLVACGAGGWGLGRRSMAILGVGMVPRGEIGFAVASVGLSAGTISTSTFSAIVAMSIATAVVAPPALQLLYRRHPSYPIAPS
jgi:Kef-type K+ transport system membrane component KefB